MNIDSINIGNLSYYMLPEFLVVLVVVAIVDIAIVKFIENKAKSK